MSNNDRIECLGCGKHLHETAIICPNCGAPIRKIAYKDKTVAAVLAILIGGFGVHRFYLRQWWGIFYLFLFWTFIPAVISMVEGVVFLCRNQEKWDKKYNQGMPNFYSGNNAIIWFLVAIFGLLMFVSVIGILAAIALPAYSDYTKRVKVYELLNESSPIKAKIVDYRLKNNDWPSNNQSDFSLLNSTSFREQFSLGDNGHIIVTIPAEVAPNEKQPQTIILQPSVNVNDQVSWTCSAGTLVSRLRPPSCRE